MERVNGVEIFIYIVLACLSTLGILELIRFISLHILTASYKIKRFVIYPVGGDTEDLELLIRSIYQKSQWEDSGDTETILLDLGLDEEGKRIARILQYDLKSFYFCAPKDLGKLVEERSQAD